MTPDSALDAMGKDIFLLGCAITASVSIPLIAKLVPPNKVYGFRTPETLSNRELWFDANHFAGWAMLDATLASALLLMFVPEWAQSNPAYDGTAFALPLMIAVAASFAYVRRRVSNGD